MRFIFLSRTIITLLAKIKQAFSLYFLGKLIHISFPLMKKVLLSEFELLAQKEKIDHVYVTKTIFRDHVTIGFYCDTLLKKIKNSKLR